MSKVQDDEVGDGTTSVTVLAAELLRVKTITAALKVDFMLLLIILLFNPPFAGGRASHCQENPPSDHHCRVEEGNPGGQRRSKGGCCRPQVGKRL